MLVKLENRSGKKKPDREIRYLSSLVDIKSPKLSESSNARWDGAQIYFMHRRRILCTDSFLLISHKFATGESGPNRAIKFLYAPDPPPPTVWALKPPTWALVHKTTHAPMIYTVLCIMFSKHFARGCINHRCINSNL
jgi:hypothetical protein